MLQNNSYRSVIRRAGRGSGRKGLQAVDASIMPQVPRADAAFPPPRLIAGGILTTRAPPLFPMGDAAGEAGSGGWYPSTKRLADANFPNVLHRRWRI